MGVFQSTPPVKAATEDFDRITSEWSISIHAAREGGDWDERGMGLLFAISIHAAREGGDYHKTNKKARIKISIHAAREGGDSM